jgi:hypothetical protein
MIREYCSEYRCGYNHPTTRKVDELRSITELLKLQSTGKYHTLTAGEKKRLQNYAEERRKEKAKNKN